MIAQNLNKVFKILLISIAFLQISPVIFSTQYSDTIPNGGITDTIICKANPKYSYAVYLPQSYLSANKWPIIFVFDPGANGKIEAELFQESAEKYGYIIVCSNNSRNGPWEEIDKAIEYTWNDAMKRFHIDESRIYTAGFSGGSKAALYVALKTQKVAGVIGYGAGFPPSNKYLQSQLQGFDYVGIIGKNDFNYLSMMELSDVLKKHNINKIILTSDLGHELPKKETIMEAMDWIELYAIKSGKKTFDKKFIDTIFIKRINSILDLEKSEDILDLSAYLEYLIQDFEGLKNITPFANKLDSIQNTKDYRSNRENINEIYKFENKKVLELLGNSNFIILQNAFNDSLFSWYLSEIQYLKKLKNKSKPFKEMAARTLGSIFMIFVELGDELKQKKEYDLSIKCYKLCIEVYPEKKYALYQLACSQVLNKNYTLACKSIKRLKDLGSTNLKELFPEEVYYPMYEKKCFLELLYK